MKAKRMTAENQGFLISSYYCASRRKKKKKLKKVEREKMMGRKEGRKEK